MGFFTSIKHILAPHTAYSDGQKYKTDAKTQRAELQAQTEIKLAKMEQDAEREARRLAEDEARRAERMANANAGLQDIEGGFN